MLHIEGLLVGVKEGIKLAIILLLSYAYFKREDRRELFIALLSGLFLVVLVGWYISFLEVHGSYEKIIVKLMGFSFGIFYILTILLFYHYTVTELFGPLRRYLLSNIFLFPFVIMLTMLYLVPDTGGTILYLKEQVRLSEGLIPVVSFLTGLFFIILCIYIISRFLKRETKKRLLDLFDLPQFILTFSIIKLLAGGVKGFAEFTLIPMVQSGLIKLIHDVVHQIFVTIMVPDHMLLRVSTWNFINIFFSEGVAFYLSNLVLFFPLLLFLFRYIKSPVEIPVQIKLRATRRKYIKRIRDQKLWKGLPVLVFLIIILALWFSQREGGVTSVYDPEPQPLIAEDGKVVIPISSPAGDLRDGLLHKFSVDVDEETVVIIVMQKEDGSFATCLDACEICPPMGYLQREKHLVCIYCGTPIPIDTLGKQGGCNPIPLKAIVTDNDIQIELSEIKMRWDMVKTAGTKELVE